MIAFDDTNISSVGFHLSHVNPEGTIVDAYGEPLGRVEISKRKRWVSVLWNEFVFCGLEPETATTKLVVSPSEKTDLDFAIDDFTFNGISK